MIGSSKSGVQQSIVSSTLNVCDTTLSAYSPFSNRDSSVQIRNSANSQISIPQESLQFATDDFTIEGFIYIPNNGAAYNGVVTDGENWTLYASHTATANNNWYWENTDTSGTGITYNVWQHFALVRYNNTVTCYVAGSANHTASIELSSVNNASNLARFGKAMGLSPNCNFSNLRVTRRALYTAPFAPPTTPLNILPQTTYLYEDPYGTNSVATSPSGDPFYDKVSLLLHLNGTNGSTTIVDSSPSPKSFTASGSFQLSTAQMRFGSASLYANGTANGTHYLTSTDTTACAFGTGDFTIECWVHPLTLNGFNIIDTRKTSTGGGATRLQMGVNSSGNFQWIPYPGASGVVVATTTNTIKANEWSHIAIVRHRNLVTFYINGIKDSISYVDNYNYTAEGITIGATGFALGYGVLNGYIDEIRITKGVARYHSNTILPFIENDSLFDRVALLLHCDGTNGSTIFTDRSTANTAVTVNGGAQVSTLQKRFNNGSLFCNGGYLSLGSAPDVSSGDYTVEGWFYFTTNSIGYQPLLVRHESISDARASFFLYTETNNQINFLCTTTFGSWTTVVGSGIVPVTNTWYHLAVTRSGSTITLWVNGVASGTGTATGTQYNVNQSWNIGRYVNFPGGSRTFTGYIDEVRITLGVARYTSNFTPPASVFSEVWGDAHYGNVSLLALGNGGNNTNMFTDSSPSPKTLTAGGSIVISTSDKKYGSGSIVTTGSTTDYVACPNSADFAFGTGDFTIESWVNVSNNTAANHICSNVTVGGGSTVYQFQVSNTGKIRFATETTQLLLGTTTIPTNTWVHVAVTRSAGTLRCFYNGTLDGSVADTTNFSSTQGPDICNGPGSRASSTGVVKVDDLRITKGVARYTSNFPAPPRELPIYHTPSVVPTYFDSPATSRLTPFNQQDRSLKLNGTNQYVRTTPTQRMSFTQGAMTIEFWFYRTASATQYCVARHGGAQGWSATNGLEWVCVMDASNIAFQYKTGSGTFAQINSGTTPATNTWHHIAIGYDGTTFRAWLNGTSLGTSTTAPVAPTTSNLLEVGNNSAYTNSLLSGNITNLRLVAADVYGVGNASITVPTSPLRFIMNTLWLFQPPYNQNDRLPLQSIPVPGAPFNDTWTDPYNNLWFASNNDPYARNVSLLLHFDGTNGSTTFTDDSLHGHVQNSVVGAYLDTTNKKFGTASGYSPNVNSYVTYRTTPGAGHLHFGTDPFTVEFYIYHNGFAGNAIGIISAACQTSPVWHYYNGGWQVSGTGNQIAINTAYSDTTFFSSTLVTVPPATWNHVAFVRNGTELLTYVNGVSAARNTISSNLLFSTDGLFGVFRHDIRTNYSMVGALDDLRLTKGVAKYTTPSFTLPTTSETGVYYVVGNTLLLHFDGANASTTFIDSSQNNYPISRIGTGITISNGASKFGGTSLSASGGTDYLAVPYDSLLSFSSSDFTIEFWINPTSIAAGGIQPISNYNANNNFSFAVFITTAGQVQLFVSSNGTTWNIANAAVMGTISTGTWSHVAVTRKGSTFYTFVNGTAGATASSSAQIFNPILGFYIAGSPLGTYTLNGYMDELRITRGVARYVSSFSPPTLAFPSN